MKVIAHDGVAQQRTHKNLSRMDNPALNPKLSVLERLLQKAILGAEPRMLHIPGHGKPAFRSMGSQFSEQGFHCQGLSLRLVGQS